MHIVETTSRKHYITPSVTLVSVPVMGILEGSEENTGGLTGNVDGTDKVIGNGGKDQTENGMSGDAKIYEFVPWEDFEKY